MGYANVFWADERPIRRYLEDAGDGDEAKERIGYAILRLTAHDTHGGQREPQSGKLGDVGDAFTSAGSFHSTDLTLLIWTGSRLVQYPQREGLTGSEFRSLAKLDAACRSDRWISPMNRDERERVSRQYGAKSGGYKHHNPLQNIGAWSVYWIYEDFTRDYARRPETDWPAKEVGEAIVKMMLDVWHASAGIGSSGNALNKAGAFIEAEFASFVWAQNCLRRVSDLDNTERERMGQWLDEAA